jgi:RimJ/RimL family protein N-acetyltransferase
VADHELVNPSQHDGRVPYLVSPALPAGSLSEQPQPVLTGTAVTLRRWTAEDVPDLVTAYADPDIQRWHCRSLDDVEAVALIEQWNEAWIDETAASWAVTDGARVLGRVGFREVDLSAGVAEVAYWVLPAARGRGVARDALATLTRWALTDLCLQRLELSHSTENAASCRVADAVAYPPEGTLRASVLHTDGWHDMHLHARLRP